MIPEIALLKAHFDRQPWNVRTQREYMDLLRDEQFFCGRGKNDPAFSARDRINRAPKALGFVTLSPVISLTPAGNRLIAAKHVEEVLLRQMLKFQLPSPYHTLTPSAAHFWVRPYLELLRLVRTLGTLTFDELQLFGMQLTDWHEFERIVKKINGFRLAKAKNVGNYKAFKREYARHEVETVYSERISAGATKTRESVDASADKFINTQLNNMRDYADACFRYLKATGLVIVSYYGKSLSIDAAKLDDVDYILANVERDPVYVDDERAYVEYLGSDTLPILRSDNRDGLITKISQYDVQGVDLSSLGMDELKDLLNNAIDANRRRLIDEQVRNIKMRQCYDDIQCTFDQIIENKLYDAPLMLEWNVWRAMTMLDAGHIVANLSFDDSGHPMSTAQGNVADIVCDYGDFNVCVEVTMSSGQRQYEMEGEPVMRHLGKMNKTTGKPCYCLFVAPTVNDSCLAYFYALHHLELAVYGGKTRIVPLPLAIFRKMLEDAQKSEYIPDASRVRHFFDNATNNALICQDERQWAEAVAQQALHWLD